MTTGIQPRHDWRNTLHSGFRSTLMGAMLYLPAVMEASLFDHRRAWPAHAFDKATAWQDDSRWRRWAEKLAPYASSYPHERNGWQPIIPADETIELAEPVT